MEQIFHFTAQDGGTGLTGLLEKVSGTLQDRKVPQGVISKLEIAVEELVLNTFQHGGGGDRAVEVAITGRSDEEWLDVVILDNGNLFNPLECLPPDSVEKELQDRPIGGLGIHLVLELMDEVSYREDDGRNCVTLRCKFG
ncbi:MAG: ATP-binding protein [Gammaproteobacteria bacterium]|nr:ATP-binding protein [Gammaproteobacteria bacterium]